MKTLYITLAALTLAACAPPPEPIVDYNAPLAGKAPVSVPAPRPRPKADIFGKCPVKSPRNGWAVKKGHELELCWEDDKPKSPPPVECSSNAYWTPDTLIANSTPKREKQCA